MRWVHYGLVSIFLVLTPVLAAAAPYAALVMDARTGEVLYSTNADTRLHPASLTKMMTLYIAFEAVEKGEISLDTMVTVSARAAGEQPSRLGLRSGQKIALRYLIRAAAIKSANDAATAIAEAIEGSVPAFAARMNRTAKALGMKSSTFKNANGLTESGHLSTARDMTLLGRRLFYDYPEYYNLFSRRSADAGVSSVSNTNTRFLDSYDGADGIKTGYTSAAGFNLTASAERGSKRIIATVLGGTSTPQRNTKMAELLDLGFSKAPSRVREQPPAPPVYAAQPALPSAQGSTGAKTVRVTGAVQTSPRPTPRPGPADAPDPALVADADPLPAGPVFAQSEPAQPETLVLAAEPPVARAAATPEVTAPTFAQSEPAQPETLALAAAPALIADPAASAAVALAESLVAPAAAPVPDELAVSVANADVAQPPLSPLLLDRSPRPARAPRTAPDAAPLAVASAEPATAPAPQTPAPVEALSPIARPSGAIADAPVLAEVLNDLPPLVLADAAQAATAAPDPVAPPVTLVLPVSEPAQPETVQLAAAAAPLPAAPEPTETAATPMPAPRPAPLADGIILTAHSPPAPSPQEIPEVVTRLSTSGSEGWGVSLGKFHTSYNAERALLQTALMEAGTLGEAERKVVNRKAGFDATYVGMSREVAEMACRRLTTRQMDCAVIGP